MSELLFITTEDCHFCEQGRGVLDSLGVERRTNLHLTLVSITNDDQSVLFQAAAGYKVSTALISDASRKMTNSFHALGGGMHADTASHTFILVDKAGTVRFDKDYPNMWIEPASLLKLLPKLS